MIEHLPEIGITIFSNWIFNCYLIHDGGEGRPLVIDVGLPSHVPAIEAELARLGSHHHALSCAVATHGHGDHVGGLLALRELVPLPVALPQGIADLLAGAPVRTPGLRDIAHILPVMADQPFSLAPYRELAPLGKQIGYSQLGVFFPFVADEWLIEGDHLPMAPDWEVLVTPGHTDDSISFYNAKTRTLLSGDAVLAVDRRGWFNPEFVDAELSAKTEARLRTLDVEYLLPGHGRAVAGANVMGDALSFRERPPDAGVVRTVQRLFRGHGGAH